MFNKFFYNIKNFHILKQLKIFKITKYTILTNGSIDVFQNVDLSGMGLTIIPIQFNKVIGSFNISDNLLTSLKGSPIEVTGDFDCSYNQLENLSFGPQNVGKKFHCGFNKLKNLIGSPNIIFSDFICVNNELTTLKGSPSLVDGSFNCEFNQLTDLHGLPSTISQTLNAQNNLLKSLTGLSSSIGKELLFINNPDLLSFNNTYLSYKELRKKSDNFSQINILNTHHEIKKNLLLNKELQNIPVKTKKKINKI